MSVEVVTALSFLLLGTGVFLLVNTLLVRSANPEKTHKRRPAGTATRILAACVPQLQVEISGIERDLRRAGNYRTHAVLEYLANRNALLLGILCLTLCVALTTMNDRQALPIVITTGLVVIIAAYGLPRFHLHNMANSRVLRIQRGLPDALDVIAMCLTGGLPLRDALERVGEELHISHPDVSREFEIITVQSETGSIGQALRQFAQRLDIPDIKALAAIVGHTERLGTNVATAIKDYADNVRTTRRQRAEERANKMTIKMLFPVIFCLAPPVFILLCGPPILELREYFNRTENRPGQILNTTPAE